jgi:hypothetical protein
MVPKDGGGKGAAKSTGDWDAVAYCLSVEQAFWRSWRDEKAAASDEIFKRLWIRLEPREHARIVRSESAHLV